MEKEFIPYTESLALKELGFDESCFAVYKSNGDLGYFQYFNINRFIEDASRESNYSDLLSIECYAPLYQQVFRWFREKYDISSFVKKDFKDTKLIGWYYGIEGTKNDFYSKSYKTYEEAEVECLKKLIEIVKEK
jgi:hypothetical protein